MHRWSALPHSASRGRFRLFLALTLAAGAVGSAHPAEPLSLEQIEKLERELSRVEETITGKRLSTRTSALNAFRSASASEKASYAFFLQCVEVVRFERNEARASEFREWRDRNEDRLRQPGHLSALRLQLAYLVLTLRAAEGASPDTLVPDLESFASSVVTAAGHDLDLKTLRESVSGTVFAQAYELDKTLNPENWSLNPGDLGSLYEDTILPHYRGSQPDGLAGAWDRRIKLESELVAIVQEENPAALESFRTEALPDLHYRKFTDIYQAVSQQAGAIGILNLLKTHPDHPNAGEWLQEFRELLNQALPEAASSPPR